MRIPEGYRLVERLIWPGEQYVSAITGEVYTWSLSVPSQRLFHVLERIPTLADCLPNQQTSDWTARIRAKAKPAPKRKQLLVIVWEIVDHPANTLTQISPALAEAWVTPAYAEGVVKAGYVATIVDAPE